MDEEQTLPDPEELQRQEAQAQQKLDALEEKRRALRQERQTISRETEDLSVWEDRIAALCDERQSLQKSCTLADRTMELLNLAKDRLANRYVADVERGFTRYAKRASGRKSRARAARQESVPVHRRAGARRARRQASAPERSTHSRSACAWRWWTRCLRRSSRFCCWTTRSSISTTRGRSALELLQKISQQRQVVYLVCNSARV